MKDKDELEIEKILENYKSDTNVLATDKIYQNKLTARFFKNDKTYQNTLILNICLIAIFFIACVSAMVFLGIKSNFDTTQKIIIEIILSLVCLGGIGVMTFILIKKKKLHSVVFEDKTIAFYSNDAIVVLDESNYRINFKDIKKADNSQVNQSLSGTPSDVLIDVFVPATEESQRPFSADLPGIPITDLPTMDATNRYNPAMPLRSILQQREFLR